MRVLDIEQNSPQWKALRSTKVGASDIAILMTGTEKEINNLFWEKFGEDKYQTSAMRRGSDMEAEARRWFEGVSGVSFDRPVALHDSHSWLLASFDGLNFELGLSLEIKCPNVVPESISDWKSYERYFWQVQAQMAVGGHDKSILLAYSPTKQVHEVISRDEKAIDELIAKGKWFYDLMQANTPPFPVKIRDDHDAVEASEAAKLLKEQMDALEEQWKIMRDGLIYLAGDTSFECNGVRVTKVVTAPKIDYRAAFETLCPNADISPFLRPSKPSWRVSV